MHKTCQILAIFLHPGNVCGSCCFRFQCPSLFSSISVDKGCFICRLLFPRLHFLYYFFLSYFLPVGCFLSFSLVLFFLSFCLSVYFHPVSPPFSLHFRYPLPVPSSSPIFGPIEVEPNAGTPRRRPLSFCPCCAHEGNVSSCIPSIHVPNCSWIYIGTLVNMWQFKYFTKLLLSFLLTQWYLHYQTYCKIIL